jgi:hypothetical protein
VAQESNCDFVDPEKNRCTFFIKGRGLEAGIPHFKTDWLATPWLASHCLIQMLGKKYGLAISEAMYDLLNE